jgi:beta-lactamase superfamily II metal-dependent hydrolase
MPTAGSERHVSPVDPNELTVALWVEAGDKRIILGGDLLEGPLGCGWRAVVATFTPSAPASVYKVAHHGSITGHHDPMWDQLVTADCVAVLTPYRSSGLPTPEDVQRIKGRTPNGYATAQSRRPSLTRDQRKARAQLGGAVRSVSDPWGRVGHVRARSRTEETSWRVGMRGPAYML